MFNLEALRAIVGKTIYARGENYYRSNRVQIESIDAHRIDAKVFGSETYSVTVNIKDKIVTAGCTCPFFQSSQSYCKHIVATIIHAERQYKERLEKRQIDWKALLRTEENETGRQNPSKNKLFFALNFYDYGWQLKPVMRYIKKDGSPGRQVSFSMSRILQNSVQATASEKLVVFFLHSVEDSYFSTIFNFGDEIGHILSLLRQSQSQILNYSSYKYSSDDWIEFYPNDLDARFIVEKQGKDYAVSLYLEDPQENKELKIGTDFRLLTSGQVFIYHNSIIYPVKQKMSAQTLIPFFENDHPILIPKSEIAQFLKFAYPKLATTEAHIVLPEEFKMQHLNLLVKKVLYLREEDGQLKVNLQFYYSDSSSKIPPISVDAVPFNPSEIKELDGKYLLIERQEKVEGIYKNILEENSLTLENTEYKLASKVQPYDWLFDTLPLLAKHGFEIYGEEKLKTLKVRRATPKLISKVSSGMDWFDLEVEIDFDGLRVSYFEIARALRRQKKYIVLSDGTAVRLTEEIVEKLGLISHFAQTSPDKNTMHLSKTQTLLLDEILKGSSAVKTDRTFKKQLRKIKNFSKIKPAPVPQNFRGELRPYQKAGLDWLSFLNEYGFGGCLADDMGLGKTIQALALLQGEKEKLKKPLVSLIVAPTSVITNWKLEAERFTPELSIYVHNGPERTESAEFLKKFDLIVTSYALLWRDYKLFKDVDFHYCILDESQKIKNPFSLTAKTARNIKARHRLVLTGTPIENNLLELWSQFEFLNPGMLGSVKSFTTFYSKSIEKEGDTKKAEQLRRLIYPFILRRTKEKVAKELPSKTENLIFCEMDDAQLEAYRKWRDYYRAQILKAIEEKGLNRSKMKVLEGLTRLRQLSIHPAMVDASYRKSSGKFDALWNILEEILSENHKVLIFSQFVKSLALVRKKLDDDKRAYLYLDGRTKKRQELIDRFQNDDEIKIFLISLKAGGLGLNLTAAEYIIHLDPWWNPAVENQATDRAYRIGQTKNVFVYKLITRESVEEKILALQEKKKKLAQDFITTDAAFFKNLEKKDIEQLFA